MDDEIKKTIHEAFKLHMHNMLLKFTHDFIEMGNELEEIKYEDLDIFIKTWVNTNFSKNPKPDWNP